MPVACESCGADTGVSPSMPPDPEQLERDRRLRLVNVPHGFARASLADWPDHGPTKRIRMLGQRFVDVFADPPAAARVLVFHGPTGTGKTHFAVAIAVHLATAVRVDARYARFPDVVRELRAGPDVEPADRELSVLERYRAYGLLVLDDLQAAAVEDLGETAPHLFDIVETRYDFGRPTVLITNDAGRVIVEGLLLPAGRIQPTRIPFGEHSHTAAP